METYGIVPQLNCSCTLLYESNICKLQRLSSLLKILLKTTVHQNPLIKIQRKGGISGLGGLMFEISSKVQQIWYS